MNVKVIADSGQGLDQNACSRQGIDLLPLQVTIDGKQYLDGVDLDTDTMYDALEEGKMPSTSMPPLGLVEDLFEQYDEEGVTDVILITLSNGLSGTNMALQANAKDHSFKIHTLDLYTTLMVQQYAAIAAAQLAAKGVAPEEIISRLEEAIQNSKGYLIPEDLNHLVKGGRLTPMAAALGGLLKIKPVLEVSKDTGGKVDVFDKVRTMGRAIRKAAAQAGSDLQKDREYVFFVVDARSPEAAGLVADALKDVAGEDIKIVEGPIASVIASHTGMGAVGFQYIPAIEGVEI